MADPAKAAEPSIPIPRSNELRERILRASVELIEAEGLAKLSMREVARRAGVTHQAPYHHFANREAILGEIVAQGFQTLCERIDRAVEIEGQGPEVMIERLLAMGRAYVEFACDHPAHYRIMFRPELVNLGNCPRAQAEGTNAFMRLQRLVHEAVASGLPAHPSEEALLAFLWSVGHGLSYLILDGPLGKKMPETARDAQIAAVIGQLESFLRASLRHANAERA